MSEEGSMLGPDPLETARALQGALQGMTAQLAAVTVQLAAVKATVRVGKRIIIGLTISLCLDLLVTVGFGWNTIRVNAAENATRAVQAASHANQVSACQQGNVARIRDAAFLNQLIADLAPPAVRTAKVQAELAVLNRLIAAKDTPRDCVAAYRVPSASSATK